MEELFALISAFNRLKEKIVELTAKVDTLTKTPALQVPPEYLEEPEVCRILHIKPRTLEKMRVSKVISYYKSGHKYLYLHSDIQEYLDKNCRFAGESNPRL